MADRGTAQRLDVAVQQPKGWVSHAACRNRMDLFVSPTIRRGRPRRGEIVDGKRVVKSYEDKIAEAKAICRGCPVLEPCRDWALTDPDPAEAMIAGGLTFNERVGLRKATSLRQLGSPAPLTPVRQRAGSGTPSSMPLKATSALTRGLSAA